MDSSGTYKNGIKDGKWTRWYENEQKKEEEPEGSLGQRLITLKFHTKENLLAFVR